jgi:hypothetical protein
LAGHWKLVIDATQFVTGLVIPVWVGLKLAGNDPVGQYTRQTGCDLTPALTVAAA